MRPMLVAACSRADDGDDIVGKRTRRRAQSLEPIAGEVAVQERLQTGVIGEGVDRKGTAPGLERRTRRGRRHGPSLAPPGRAGVCAVVPEIAQGRQPRCDGIDRFQHVSLHADAHFASRERSGWLGHRPLRRKTSSVG
jgi:hypothetical protein